MDLFDDENQEAVKNAVTEIGSVALTAADGDGNAALTLLLQTVVHMAKYMKADNEMVAGALMLGLKEWDRLNPAAPPAEERH